MKNRLNYSQQVRKKGKKKNYKVFQKFSLYNKFFNEINDSFV